MEIQTYRIDSQGRVFLGHVHLGQVLHTGFQGFLAQTPDGREIRARDEAQMVERLMSAGCVPISHGSKTIQT